MSDLDREADDIERIKEVLDTLYDAGDTCIHPDDGHIVSDPEYDLLVKRLREIRPNSTAFKGASSSTLTTTAAKIKHDPPLTSLEKCIGSLSQRTNELEEWRVKCVQELGLTIPTITTFTKAYKLDGVACALYYKAGKLVGAGLRPRNYIDGENVIANVKYVIGIPETLPLRITCSIRGELYCPKSVFERKNKELAEAGEKTFANPRNYTAGSIRQYKDPKVTGDREIYFRAYSICGLDKPPYRTEIERAKWCNQVLMVPFVRVMPLAVDLKTAVAELQEMEDKVTDIDYEVDGVVVSVNLLDDQEQMGKHGNSVTGSPRGKVAWKFAEEIGKATIKEITLGVGRTGDLTPVLEFEVACQLAGTNVYRCTGHNLGFLRANQIGVGTVIEVVKSGKIIPKVHRVLSGQVNWQPPSQCPSCNGNLTVRAGNEPGKEALHCPNEFCGERAVAKLINYLTVFGVKGLGDSLVTKLHDNQIVRTPADFYRMTPEQLLKLDVGERNSYLAVARVHMVEAPEKIKDQDALEAAIKTARASKKEIPLRLFIQALGVPGLGKGGSQALESHFKSLDGILKASVEDLAEVEDMGDKTAEGVREFLDTAASVVQDLLCYIEPILPKIGKLTGTTFVFTGGFPEGKDHWEKAVQGEGAKVSGSVSKKTTYVVVGTDAGSKEQKARDLGIPMLALDDLKRML